MDWNIIFGQALTQGLGVQAIIFALAAIGLNVHFGYTGLLNFGQAGFLAVGAYALGVTVATFGQSLWLGVLYGLLASIVLALLLGVPTLRLRADYLAIVTIASAEIIRLIVRSVTFRETFGGSDGINGFATEFYALNPFATGLVFGPIAMSANDLWITVVGWVLVAVALLLVFLLMRSPGAGCSRGSARTRTPCAASARTSSPTRCRPWSSAGSSAPWAGFVFACRTRSVQPDNYAPASRSSPGPC
jgi:neutral amino acid transport system permease protein